MSELAPNSTFDEAARLYVQYLPVVQEMARAFDQAVQKFFLDVRQVIEKRSAPLQIDDDVSGTWQCWWLTKRKNAPEEVPYLWFYHRKPEIVIPGQLEFTINVVPEAKSLRPRVEKALREIESKLLKFCVLKKKPAEGGIASYVISYGKSVHPVQDVAETFLLILTSIEPIKMP